MCGDDGPLRLSQLDFSVKVFVKGIQECVLINLNFYSE